MTLDLRTMFQTWVTVLSRPSEQVFEAERLNPLATLHTALMWVFLTAVVTTILNVLHTQFMPSPWRGIGPLLNYVPTGLRPLFELTPPDTPLNMLVLLGGVIVAPIFFCITVGIQHLIASAWGSDRIRLEPSGEVRKGKFGQYAYLNATFYAPIALISAVFAFVPIAGFLIGTILSIYSLRLSYLVTRVEYGLSTGNAILVVLSPLFVAILLALGGGIVFSVVSGLFS